MDLQKTKLLCKVDNEKELALVIRRYNTKLEGGEEVYAQDLSIVKRTALNSNANMLDIYELIAKRLSSIKARDEKILAAAKELCRILGDFTEDDLGQVLKRIGLKGDILLEKYIPKLMDNNVIFEPKRGVYRCLEGC
jgi:hypothetical protein